MTGRMEGRLNTQPELLDPDAVYASLLAMHDGKSDDESARLNARLIMLLLNHVGDDNVALEAISLAGREPLA